MSLPLDDESSKFVTVNTLFKYNRLPFGVASAPVIFQRCIVQGIDGVSVYIDDILSTIDKHVKKPGQGPGKNRDIRPEIE